MKIPLDQASYQQLLNYAQLSLGLEVKNGTHTAKLLAAIEAAKPGITEIDLVADAAEILLQPPFVAVDTAAGSAEIPVGKDGAHYRYDPKVTVNINESETAKNDVILSVNGDSITVKRGVDVAIPYRFYLAMKQAEETIYRDTDELDRRTGLPIKEAVVRPATPFNTVGQFPSASEIAAFHQRTSEYSL